MEKHEIGQYSTASGDILDLYMLEFPTGRSDAGEVIPAAVVYNMEAVQAKPLLFWHDWLAFAHAVNRIAGDDILDIHDVGEDPAVKAGLVVDVGMECPGCGCRVVDALAWVDESNERVWCEACQTIYTPGEQ
jgi:hypothetical protein